MPTYRRAVNDICRARTALNLLSQLHNPEKRPMAAIVRFQVLYVPNITQRPTDWSPTYIALRCNQTLTVEGSGPLMLSALCWPDVAPVQHSRGSIETAQDILSFNIWRRCIQQESALSTLRFFAMSFSRGFFIHPGLCRGLAHVCRDAGFPSHRFFVYLKLVSRASRIGPTPPLQTSCTQ